MDPGAAGVGAAATSAWLQRNAVHPIGTGGTRPIDPATHQPINQEPGNPPPLAPEEKVPTPTLGLAVHIGALILGGVALLDMTPGDPPVGPISTACGAGA